MPQLLCGHRSQGQHRGGVRKTVTAQRLQNQNTQLNNKYRIVNKLDTPHPNYNNLLNEFNKQNNMSNPTLEQFGKMGQNLSNNSDNNGNKLSNQNIFVSHKNSSKYGIKFV